LIETTKETCKICGKQYDDVHIVPRAPFAPYFCPECENQINTECGGSWLGAVFQSVKNQNENAPHGGW
jgi:hypothetical protein